MDWDVSWATWSGFDDDGYPLVQLAGYGPDRKAVSRLQHQYGFVSRPHDQQGSDRRWCTAFLATDGHDEYAFLGTDPRFIPDTPRPTKGGNSRYVAFQENGEWRVAWDTWEGDSGTRTLYIPIGDSSLSMVIGKDANGDPTYSLTMPDGSALTAFDGSWVLSSPSGSNYIEVSDRGIVLKGNVTNAGGISPPGGTPLAHARPTMLALEALRDAVAALVPNTAVLDQPGAAAATTALAALAGIAPTIPTRSTRGS